MGYIEDYIGIKASHNVCLFLSIKYIKKTTTYITKNVDAKRNGREQACVRMLSTLIRNIIKFQESRFTELAANTFLLFTKHLSSQYRIAWVEVPL